MAVKATDLTNKRFGHWLVLGRAVDKKYSRPYWICQCSCGNIKTIVGNSLTTGGTTNCGCVPKKRKIKEEKPFKKCVVPNCTNSARSNGFCSRHYEQTRIYGKITNDSVINRINGYDHNSDGSVSLHLYDKYGNVKAKTFVDKYVLPKILDKKWYLLKNGYVVHKNGKSSVYLHRLLTNAEKNKTIDHIDGNTLNNRLINLRFVTQEQNMWNSKKPVTNTSGFKGVCYDKRRNKWIAQISIDGITKHLGRFPTREAAYEVYKQTAIELRGEYARL